jgi:epoxyqueuosine reductase
MPSAAELSSFIKAAASRAGFDLCGVAALEQSSLPELNYFEKWVDAGYAGEMHYLKARHESGELKRANVSETAPWARSVVVCGINYDSNHRYSTEAKDPSRGWVARYAWSREDYHDVVLRKLRQVEAELSLATNDASITTRCYVDTGPHVERVYAKYAGIGWTGKNTCIINQQLGSWIFLGIILTSLELAVDLPAADRCGTCTRCIAACPTQAILEPYKLDATRCISYLTIEKRGSVPEELRRGIGNNIFGCDICQDVCPWNGGPAKRAPFARAEEFQARPELVNPALAWLAEITREDFQQTFRRSPVKRAKFSGLKRNVAVSMGNSGEKKFIPQLERMTQDEDAVVSEHARWALAQLQSR